MNSYDNNSYYYRLDSHGNVTDLLTHTGDEIKSYTYNPYGKEKPFSINPAGNETILYHWKNETENTHNPFRYCGEYYDEESGLIYLRNRYYDPSIGRFISEDPARDGNNWYAYCGGNPLNYVDPWGLEDIVVAGGAYDQKSGKDYQYTFVDPALKRVEEFDGKATLLVADAGWDTEQKRLIENVAEEKGINLIWFSDTDTLTNYINNGKDRSVDPITSFTVFAHGTDSGTGKYAITFGLYSSNDFRWYTEEISKIKSSAFANGVVSTFYACRTGNNFKNGNFAEKWQKKAGGTTYAFSGKNGRTDYSNINGYWYEYFSRAWKNWYKKRGPVELKPGASWRYPSASDKTTMRVFTSKGNAPIGLSW